MVLFPHWPAGYSEVQSRYLETLIHAKACGNVGVCIKRADLSVRVSRTPDGCFYLACRMQVCGTFHTIFFSLLFFFVKEATHCLLKTIPARNAVLSSAARVQRPAPQAVRQGASVTSGLTWREVLQGPGHSPYLWIRLSQILFTPETKVSFINAKVDPLEQFLYQ